MSFLVGPILYYVDWYFNLTYLQIGQSLVWNSNR